jgi:site-specific DNA-methyltransferase (adenine-specific)
VIRLAEEIDLNKATKDELREIVKAIKEVPTSILEADRPAKSEDHPTMKPIPLIGEQIKNSTRRGEIVLDPFGGSGTTLIAADQIGRTCYMVEYDPKYIDVIVRRWEEQAGMKANLIGNRYREGAQTPEPEK